MATLTINITQSSVQGQSMSQAQIPNAASNMPQVQPLQGQSVNSILQGYNSANTVTSNSALGIYALNQGIQIAKQTASATVNYFTSTYGERTGDYVTQNKINNVQMIMNQVSSVTSSIVGGASAGAVFGPVGVVVGTGLGAIAGGISSGINYLTQSATLKLQTAKSNLSINYYANKQGNILLNGSR